MPGEQSRYIFKKISYRIGPEGDAPAIRVRRLAWPPVTPENIIVASGISPPPVLGFTATATGNFDGDPVIDQWHINDQGIMTADVDDNITLAHAFSCNRYLVSANYRRVTCL